jgi:hypothetical protein
MRALEKIASGGTSPPPSWGGTSSGTWPTSRRGGPAPRGAYRLRKLARKHRAALSLSALGFSTLLLALAGSLFAGFKINAARREALVSPT